jgi:hypothetical protein
MPEVSQEMRALLQEFVDARLDAPDLFARAGAMLPPDSDPYEEVLELLAEAELKLGLPKDRRALIRRLGQFASGETSYTELDLWGFSLGQTEALSPDAPISSDAETALLQAAVAWIDEWEDEGVRPEPEEVGELVRILRRETDPGRCLAALEEAAARFRRD